MQCSRFHPKLISIPPIQLKFKTIPQALQVSVMSIKLHYEEHTMSVSVDNSPFPVWPWSLPNVNITYVILNPSKHYSDVTMSAMSSEIICVHLFRHWSKKTSEFRITGLCAGNSMGTSEFPAQRTSNVENVSIWWCHHESTIVISWTNKRSCW